MKTILAALFGAFILSTAPAQALDVYTITEAEIQQKLDAKLPLSGPTKLNGTATLLPGAHINFRANGTIEVDGAFEIRHEATKAFYRGRFNAVTNLKLAADGIHLNRTTLTDFEGGVVYAQTGDRIKDSMANLANAAFKHALNNPSTVRDIMALLFFKKLEDKPIYAFDGQKPWHALARNLLTDDSLIVSEDLLTIRIP